MENTDQQLEKSWHDDPKNWKWGGLFYYCKDDKRILVDKPNPTYGTTLNFAHAKSYIYLALCFLFFGFIVYMVTRTQ